MLVSRMSSFIRPLAASVLGLGLGLHAVRQSQADVEPVPAAGRASLIDLNLEREAEDIIADAKCPSCLREALSGPCGGAFLLLFRCQDKVTDADIENGACDTQWRNFSECYRSNLAYYDERRRLWEEEDRKHQDSEAEASATGEMDDVIASPSSP